MLKNSDKKTEVDSEINKRWTAESYYRNKCNIGVTCYEESTQKIYNRRKNSSGSNGLCKVDVEPWKWADEKIVRRYSSPRRGRLAPASGKSSVTNYPMLDETYRDLRLCHRRRVCVLSIELDSWVCEIELNDKLKGVGIVRENKQRYMYTYAERNV